MLNFKANIPTIDEENERLFVATKFLQKCGNHPGLLMDDFYNAVLEEEPDISEDDFDDILTAAIAIETMITFEDPPPDGSLEKPEPTVH